jgi:CPA2 family monovalent cation:H+ antiporter-2
VGHIPLLDELAIICALGVLVTLVLARFRLPTVAGLLAAGALAGPYGLGWVKSIHSIEILAEIGVVLLLFTIGLEFSLSRLKSIFKQVALGGVIQVGLTTAVTAIVVLALGRSGGEGIFYGFVFALSSTAIVLRALGERRELDAPHGRFIVGTLIFQDLCVVPMVLVVPLLSPAAAGTGISAVLGQVADAMLKATAVVVGVVVVARFAVPRLLNLVDANRSREVFLLTVLGLCIGTAWLTSLAGLSLALGAFLGGMVVADTEFGHRAMGDMLPLRDAFVSVFFVSLGMLFDADVVLHEPLLFGAMVAGFLLVKGLLATLAAVAMRFPPRVAWLAGVGLAQFGEFGFVLARLGREAGVVTAEALAPVLAAGILSMFLTPLLVRMAPHVTAGEKILAPLTRLLGTTGDASKDEVASHGALSGHVVLIGYGVAGRLVGRALRAAGLPYVVLELNAETVRSLRAEGEPIQYADATSVEALEHAGLSSASALVLLMNDPEAARRVVDVARRVAPEVPVLMRARYVLERDKLLDAGATDVVAEEVEGGIEMLARVLRRLEVPRNVIDEQIHGVRVSLQPAQRSLPIPRKTLSEHAALAGMKIESVLIREGAPGAGRSLVDLDLRRRTGALIIALRREGKLLDQPDPQAPLQPGDVAYVVGQRSAVDAAIDLLAAPKASSAGVSTAPPPQLGFD